jgi:predicted small secreted protein
MELYVWKCVEWRSCRPELFLAGHPKEAQMTSNTRMLRKALLALAAGTVALTASACNTVKGAGQDIESVGEAGDKVT